MKKFLVASDGTESADHALSIAIDLAKALDAVIALPQTSTSDRAIGNLPFGPDGSRQPYVNFAPSTRR